MEKWRLIIDPPLNGAENMAADEALLAMALKGPGFRPTLRLYGWSVPTISIGYLQDPAPFLEVGLPVVRRITGGRAVLHDREVTYSIVAGTNSGVFAGGVTAAYRGISGCLVHALKDFGIDAGIAMARSGVAYKRSPACFNTYSRYEVRVGDKKIAGSAQRRFRDLFLQHGSIIFGLNKDLVSRVFGPGVVKRSACLEEFAAVSMDEFRNALIKRMAQGLKADLVPGAMVEAERSLTERLIEYKYASPEWNIHRRVIMEADGDFSGELFH